MTTKWSMCHVPKCHQPDRGPNFEFIINFFFYSFWYIHDSRMFLTITIGKFSWSHNEKNKVEKKDDRLVCIVVAFHLFELTEMAKERKPSKRCTKHTHTYSIHPYHMYGNCSESSRSYSALSAFYAMWFRGTVGQSGTYTFIPWQTAHHLTRQRSVIYGLQKSFICLSIVRLPTFPLSGHKIVRNLIFVFFTYASLYMEDFRKIFR